MVDDLARNEEGAETLPSRRERHQQSKRSRKRKAAQLPKVTETSGGQKEEPTDKGHVEQTEDTSALIEEGAKGPERSELFKEKRDRQGSLFVTSTIFWLFILLVGCLLFFTIRHYS
jgi:hypothetical protein